MKRSRRYLIYAGLLVGFCILLAFVGCGSTAGIGELKATASAINFGPVTVGQASTATVSFVNSGAGAVQVSSVSISGQPFKFMGPTGFPLTVAAGSTYSFQVEFSPAAEVAGDGPA